MEYFSLYSSYRSELYPRRQNVTTSVVGLKTVVYAKISLKVVSLRDIAGERRRKRNCEGALSALSVGQRKYGLEILVIDCSPG